MSNYDQANQVPNLERRKFIFEYFPKGAIMAALLPNLVNDSIRNALVPTVPPDPGEATPQQSRIEDEVEPAARDLRIREFIMGRLAPGFFLSASSGLKPLLDKLPHDNQTENLLNYAAYRHPRFITTDEAIRTYRNRSNEGLHSMGIRVNLADLLTMLHERYNQIMDEGLVASLLDTIDPSVADFEKLTRKFSDLTGIPQDVIKTIWWRENFGIGNAPVLHGGTHSPSGDGPLAPFVHLYNMPIQPQGVYRYSTDTQRFERSFRVPPGEYVKTVAFMGDNRLAGRKNEDIIMTPIRTDLVQYDAELNIITGLILYYQALEAMLIDPLISKATQHALDQNPELDYWSVGYSVYHHGPVPVQARLRSQNEYKSLDWQDYFVAPAVAAQNTRQYQPWTQSRFKRKSAFSEDSKNLEFFDILDFYDRWDQVLAANPGFEMKYKIFHQMLKETFILPKEEGGIGFLLLCSNTAIIDFFEQELNAVVTTSVEQRVINDFIAFCREVSTILSTNTVDFESFSEVGNVSDPEFRAKLFLQSPIYQRLFLEFGYFLNERSFFSYLSEWFHVIMRAVTRTDSGSRSGSQPNIGTDILFMLPTNDVETYEQLTESLIFALTTESPPKNQGDYYKEFIARYPGFLKKFEPYQKMRSSYDHRFGSLLCQILIIPIVAANAEAKKFALDSIFRLFDSRKLVDLIAEVLNAFQDVSHLNNGVYYQLLIEDKDTVLSEKMLGNPLYAGLLEVVQNSDLPTGVWNSSAVITHILFGNVFPNGDNQFEAVTDKYWDRPDLIVDQVLNNSPKKIVDELMKLEKNREAKQLECQNPRLPR